MSPSLAPPDLEQRLQAATDFERNLVVIAGAGTGKTSLLVERILTALGSGRVEIDRLGALTFTEKAAGEMRQRLAEGLERLLTVARTSCERDARLEGDRAYGHLTDKLAIEPSDVAGRALGALRQLDRARVETIHTFCAGLLREHPLEVGLQPDFTVDPGEMQSAVLEELWERFVSRELGSPAPRAELWSHVMVRFSLERIRELAFALSSFQVPESLLGPDGPEIPEAANLPVPSGVDSIDGPTVSQAIEVAAPFAVEARDELLRRGYVSFDGLLVLARDLLRDHPGVRESLKRSLRMLLVDEFQDTDPLQYEIVLYLGEREGRTARDAYEVELEPGRLFVVGDPKQSIYRFRGADYEAFRRAVTRIVDGGGQQLHLTANFRSVPQIIEPVNALFADPTTTCWERSDYQPDYDAIEPFLPDAADAPCVEVWTVDAGAGALAKQRREAEGVIVAESIREIVEGGDVEYSEIMVG